jgi:hypothetical protein
VPPLSYLLRLDKPFSYIGRALLEIAVPRR